MAVAAGTAAVVVAPAPATLFGRVLLLAAVDEVEQRGKQRGRYRHALVEQFLQPLRDGRIADVGDALRQAERAERHARQVQHLGAAEFGLAIEVRLVLDDWPLVRRLVAVDPAAREAVQLARLLG